MIERRMISEDEKELYLYGIQLLSEKLLGLCSILLICVFTGRLLQGAVFYMAYSLLRKYAGGYHAGRFITCYISSCLTVFICVMLSFLPFAQITSLVLILISSPVVFVLAPAEHSAKPLEECEKHRYRKLTRIIAVCELCLFAVLYAFELYSLCFSMGCAFLLLSALLLLQTAINRKNNMP